MWQAYNGFTWAFGPYLEYAHYTENIDSDAWSKAMTSIDPIMNLESLNEIIVLVAVAAND